MFNVQMIIMFQWYIINIIFSSQGNVLYIQNMAVAMVQIVERSYSGDVYDNVTFVRN